MPVTLFTISTLSHYIDQALSIRDAWQKEDDQRAKEAKKRGDDEETDPSQVWFRGQENALWRLVPKLYRLKEFNENEIRTEFRLRASQLMPEGPLPRDHREWYFLMQHFGAPTRLLDWTDGALIALYFAVKAQKKYKNAAVWMLDPVWYNAQTLKRIDPNNYMSGVLVPDWDELSDWIPEPFEHPLHVSLPVAVDPPHVARRVSVQRSRFTIHGSSKRGLDVLASGFPRTRLIKFLIPNKTGKDILSDLSTCGIAETSVFPDLEGLSRELETKWTQIRPKK